MRNIKGSLRVVDGEYLVGCEGPKHEDGYQYIGPTARISHDATWLHIVTDDYEGHAMINIEALPHLRRALSQIARERSKKLHPPA